MHLKFTEQAFGDEDVSGEELHDILCEIDTNMNGQVELDEYLQVRNFCNQSLRPSPDLSPFPSLKCFKITCTFSLCNIIVHYRSISFVLIETTNF